MTPVLLAAAIVAGLISTVAPRSRLHPVLGAISMAAMLLALVTLPSGAGDYWVIAMADLAAIGLTGSGVLMLLARRHPRRRHRHIIYCGYGLVFAVIAGCWALVVEHPGGRHELAAVIASVSAYALGSVGILLYKRAQTRDLPPGPGGEFRAGR